MSDPVPFNQALQFWLKLGFISFGGPAGQIAIMHKELVEERRWISEGRFLHALNYCMLLPGPEAQQLATYLGWLMHRTWGGIAAGALFVLPSLLILIALSALYVLYGHTPTLQAVLYGVKPAVVVLVAAAAWRVGKATLKSSWLVLISIAAFIAVSVQLPFPAIVLVAALLGFVAQQLKLKGFSNSASGGHTAKGNILVASINYLISDDTPAPMHAKASVLRTLFVIAVGVVMALAAWAALYALQGKSVLTDLASFFTRAALVTFGGAYSVLPYVTQQAVEHYQWLSAPQMMDGLALGETTPGPLIMIVAFVGFLGAATKAAFASPMLAGAIGACVATFFTFLPSFIFIFAGAPWIEHTRDNITLHAPLRAISAAVVGVIASLAVYFAQHVFFANHQLDIAALVIALFAAVMQFHFKWGVLRLVGVCAALGACYSLFIH